MSKLKKKGTVVASKPKKQVKSQLVVSTAKIQGNLAKKPRGKGKPFVKDDPRINREGREPGSTNFKTDFMVAIQALKNADTDEAIEITDLIRLALEKMVKALQFGDHRFDKVYIDMLNRYYGTPTQNVDHTSKGEKLETAPQIIGMRIIKDNDENEK